uniref:Uncharacterized protein n=1 Tax=Mycena chlorophos TaxID=658473 RepID=A0ABQ0KVR1_MYCCL|nr:predicted protein [Mycena chlorophos]
MSRLICLFSPTTMSRLPPELEREIFTLDAYHDARGARRLLFFAQRVKIWIEPLLWHTFIFGPSEQTSDFTKIDTSIPTISVGTFAAILKQKPAMGAAVHTLALFLLPVDYVPFFERAELSKPDLVQAVLAAFHGSLRAFIIVSIGEDLWLDPRLSANAGVVVFPNGIGDAVADWIDGATGTGSMEFWDHPDMFIAKRRAGLVGAETFTLEPVRPEPIPINVDTGRGHTLTIQRHRYARDASLSRAPPPRPRRYFFSWSVCGLVCTTSSSGRPNGCRLCPFP